jgi:hypothetical protein
MLDLPLNTVLLLNYVMGWFSFLSFGLNFLYVASLWKASNGNQTYRNNNNPIVLQTLLSPKHLVNKFDAHIIQIILMYGISISSNHHHGLPIISRNIITL